MSSSLTVIGGASGSHVLTGLVSIPSSFGADINTSLQLALSAASGLVTTGLVNLTNFDAVTGTTFSTSPSVPGPTLYEITDTDSLGAVTTVTGGITGSFTIPVSVSGLVVEAPGSETVTGNDSTSLAVFGANSNVDYSVLSGSGSIYAAGGADSISVGEAGVTNPSYYLFSAGNDTVNLASGTDSVDVTSSTTTLQLGDASGFVTADGSSTVAVFFKANSGGTLDFVNNSSSAATIFSGAYTVAGGANVAATNAVTAFGGAGGGYFVGGKAGGNSLVGGSGVVTLQGGGSGDYLEANSSVGTNQLFSGPGADTLIGSSTSGANTFQLNLKYVGQAVGVGGTDVVSTSGSGLQSFLIGAGSGTITGSTVAGATNLFDLIRDASVGSANYTVTNFESLNGAFFITDSTQGAGSSSIQGITTVNFGSAGDPNYVTTVTLTDQTTIKFDGLQASNLSTSTSDTGAITITYHS